jgi:hypothetical protein
MRHHATLPSIESLPQATCRACGKSKLRGLFTPLELTRAEGPRCMKCTGELSERNRKAARSAWGLNPREASEAEL